MAHRVLRSSRVVLVSSLFLMSAAACDREPPKPKVVQDPPTVSGTAVGEAAIRAIEKAKGVEKTLGQAAERTENGLKSATP